MPLVIDGSALLGAIASNREAFDETQAVVDKAAVSIVIAQLKIRALTVEKLRKVRSAIGEETFALILDQFDTKALGTLVGKLDKHHPERTTASPVWARGHVRALARGNVEPTEKQAAPRRTKGTRKKAPETKAPEDRPFWPTSMEVAPRRKRE